MLNNHLTKRVLMTLAVLGLATSALVANAENSGSCRDAANREECMHAEMAKHLQEHEAKLHDALKLTAAQEPAWKAFTDSTHQQMAAMQAERHAMPSRADMEKLSAPERLQNHLAQQQKHIAAMQAHVDSLKQFYAVLTPDQRVTMDKALARMHRHHGWHRWQRWNHHHGDHGDVGTSAASTTPAQH